MTDFCEKCGKPVECAVNSTCVDDDENRWICDSCANFSRHPNGDFYENTQPYELRVPLGYVTRKPVRRIGPATVAEVHPKRAVPWK